MAAGGTDGSLRFDTKIDTSGFDGGISTLSKAVDRLSEAIDRLSGQIAQGFGDAGAAAASTSRDVDTVGAAAEKSEAKVKSLQEQMDAVSVHMMDDIAADMPEGQPRRAEVQDAGLYGYDQSVIDFMEDYANGAGKAKTQTNEFRQMVAELTAQLGSMEGRGLYFGDEEYDQAYLKLEQVKQALVDYKKEIVSPTPDAKISEPVEKGAGKVMASCAGMKASVANAFLSMSASVGRLAKSIGSKLANKIKQTVSSLKGIGKTSNGVSKSIMKLSSMLKLMLIRMAMRAAIQGVREGMQDLVQYSDSANRSMSGLVSGAGYFKNSFAAAFAPILSYVVPVLNTLIGLLATAINYVNQFFTALGGGSTFVRAKKTHKDYAESLKATGGAAKKAGKDAKKALAPFDELNQLQNNAPGPGGGGGAGAAGMFETAAIGQGISDFANELKKLFDAGDWDGIGKLAGKKINDAVLRFTDFISWGNVGTRITAFLTAFTALFNSLVRNIDWYAIGVMMGTGINTLAYTLYLLLTQIDWLMLGNALSQSLMGMAGTVDWGMVGAAIGAFFQAQISGLLGFIIGTDWGAIGTALATCIMGITGQIDWAQLGYLFGAGLNGAFAFLLEFASAYDWAGLGNQVATSLSTLFQTFDWGLAGEAISTFIIGLLDFLIAIVQETDWVSFVQGIVDCIEAIDWIGLAGGIFELLSSALAVAFNALAQLVGTLVIDGVTAARDYFAAKIEECGGNVALGILNGILDAWNGIHGWIYDHVFAPFINGIMKAFGIQGASSSELKQFGKYLWDGFKDGVKQFFASPAAFIKQHITDPFVNGIKSLLGIHSPSTVLEGVGGDTVGGFNQGVEKGQSSSKSIIQSWASGVAGWFASKLGISSKESRESKEWASSTVSGYNNTVSRNYTESQAVMEKWAGSIRMWFTGSGEAKGVNGAAWKKFADAIIKAFTSGIQSGSGSTRSPVEHWAKNIRDWFWGASYAGGTNGLYQEFYNMAKLANQGFANGIGAFSHLAQNAIREWGKEVVASARGELDIHSPSRVAYSIAEYFVKGFNNGLIGMLGSSVSAAEKWLGSVTEVFKGVEIGIPVGLDIPNAASYIPRMATGSAVPPRAGELSSYNAKYGGSRESESLLEEIRQLIKNIKGTPAEGGDISLAVNLDGDVVYNTVVKRNQIEKGRTGKNPLLV